MIGLANQQWLNMFNFGEKVAGYDDLMFNEREVRAAAGMCFCLRLWHL